MARVLALSLSLSLSAATEAVVRRRERRHGKHNLLLLVSSSSSISQTTRDDVEDLSRAQSTRVDAFTASSGEEKDKNLAAPSLHLIRCRLLALWSALGSVDV